MYSWKEHETIVESGGVASLRPRPYGPPLRGRTERSDASAAGRLGGRWPTENGVADSTLN